jgi:hypothetical protein
MMENKGKVVREIGLVKGFWKQQNIVAKKPFRQVNHEPELLQNGIMFGR